MIKFLRKYLNALSEHVRDDDLVGEEKILNTFEKVFKENRLDAEDFDILVSNHSIRAKGKPSSHKNPLWHSFPRVIGENDGESAVHFLIKTIKRNNFLLDNMWCDGGNGYEIVHHPTPDEGCGMGAISIPNVIKLISINLLMELKERFSTQVFYLLMNVAGREGERQKKEITFLLENCQDIFDRHHYQLETDDDIRHPVGYGGEDDEDEFDAPIAKE